MTKVANFRWKRCWCQQKSRGVSHDLCIFWIFFRSGTTVPNFIIAGYVWQILGRVGPFCPSREQPQKGTSWIGLTTTTVWILISFNHLLSTFYRNEILIPSCFIATQSVSSITDFFHIWFMLNICQILCLQFFNIGDKSSRYILWN